MMGTETAIRKILCVEDEEALREDISEELQDAGYETHTAKDGADGLKKILEVKPDLVVSDISMPNMDGYGLVTELRAKHPSFAEMPFIFLSALADRTNILQGMTVGADDYLTKPVDYDMLLAKVAARLRETDRMAKKKRAEHVKLYKALSAANSDEEEKEKFQWTPKTRRSIALVGESCDSLWELQRLCESAGHKVTVFTSGRSYLNKSSTLKFKLTCLWVQSDDIKASGVTKFLSTSENAHILIVPKSMHDEAKEISKNDYKKMLKDKIQLPLEPQELAERLSAWL